MTREALKPQEFAEAPPSFLADVLLGLSGATKSLPCKYFYDAAGSALFERICGLDEYYLTRTELAIMDAHAEEMAALLGPRVLLVEPGSGASVKTRLLLQALRSPVAYVPVDISATALANAAPSLAEEFPELEVVPLVGDFTERFVVPSPSHRYDRTVVYFPGSTIGNFPPDEAAAFLSRLRRIVGSGGSVLVGVDLVKSREILKAAYDDAAGITAAFNRNILVRINRELGGGFEPMLFSHVALYDERSHRIEMHLESTCDQVVEVAGHPFRFRAGERIHTESSYKYALPAFQRLAERVGFDVAAVWTDSQRWFSVQCLT